MRFALLSAFLKAFQTQAFLFMGQIKQTRVPSRNNPTATETETAAGDGREGRISLPAAPPLPAFAFPPADRSGRCSSASPGAARLHPSPPARNSPRSLPRHPPGSAPAGVAFTGGLGEPSAIRPAARGVCGSAGNRSRRRFPRNPPPSPRHAA